jgi:hypothetical protein
VTLKTRHVTYGADPHPTCAVPPGGPVYWSVYFARDPQVEVLRPRAVLWFAARAEAVRVLTVLCGRPIEPGELIVKMTGG